MSTQTTVRAVYCTFRAVLAIIPQLGSSTHPLPLVSSQVSGVHLLNLQCTSLERQAGEVLFSVHLPGCYLLTLVHPSG